MKAWLMFLCAVLALSVGVETANAGGGNSDSAKACQNGGWRTLYRADGTPFASQGDCIANAALGGTLYSTVADVSLSVNIDDFPPFGPLASFYATNAGPDPVTIRTDLFTSAAFGIFGGTETLQTGETRFLGGLGLNIRDGCWPANSWYGQVTVANAADPDSTPGNYANGFTGPAVEDDEAFAQIGAGCLPPS